MISRYVKFNSLAFHWGHLIISFWDHEVFQSFFGIIVVNFVDLDLIMFPFNRKAKFVMQICQCFTIFG